MGCCLTKACARKGALDVGANVEVKWDGDYHPATIVDLGKQNVLAKKLLEHEKQQQQDKENVGPEPCKRKRQHDQEQPAMSESSRKQLKKRQEKLQSLAVLEQIGAGVAASFLAAF